MKITNLVTLLLLLYYSKPCTAFGHLARSFAKLARPNGPSLVSLTACLLSLPDALIWMLRNFSTFGFNGCNLCWMMKEKNKVLADAKCCFFLGWKLKFSKARFFHSKENFKVDFIFFWTILTISKYDFVENLKWFFSTSRCWLVCRAPIRK